MTIRYADWPAPDTITAGVTTREQGNSHGVYACNNMALHVGDDSAQVLANRQQLAHQCSTAKQWQWLEQVHGDQVVKAPAKDRIVADACYTDQPGTVCTVMTADCLPVLLCARDGRKVAAIHAGWRSLCAGIIENTLDAMTLPADQVLAWLGPAIGPTAFEVGDDVRQAFAASVCGEASLAAFSAREAAGKYLCDIYQLARLRLQYKGVTAIYGGDFCTVSDESRFYSYRRDGVTGRMASFIYFC